MEFAMETQDRHKTENMDISEKGTNDNSIHENLTNS